MPTNTRVRRASAADAPVLATLLSELGYPSHPTDLVDRVRSLPEGHTVLVAEVGAHVAGFVHVAVDPSLVTECRAQVAGIAVEPCHRGSGVGGQLLDEAATWAREHGCHQLWVRTGADRDEVQGFYRQHRFRDVPDQVVLRREVEGTVGGSTTGTATAPVVVPIRPTP